MIVPPGEADHRLQRVRPHRVWLVLHCTAEWTLRPREKTANRRKWSKEDNVMLWRCYLLSEPEKRGYRQRLHKTWLDNNGADVTEQRLCDQRGQIEKKGWLTGVEMEMIKRELEAKVTVTNDNAVEDAVLIEAQTIDILPVFYQKMCHMKPQVK